MRSLKKKFENETKIRINILNSFNYEKLNLLKMLVKPGILEETSSINDNDYTIFPTEILCSSPRENTVRVYLSIKKEEDVIKNLKINILQAIYEACLVFVNDNRQGNIEDNDKEAEFKRIFFRELDQFNLAVLKKFYEVGNIDKVLGIIKFKDLFNELKKINYTNNQEVLEDMDDFIWKNYFSNFQVSFKKQYDKWMKRISGCYAENEDGHEYINEEKDFTSKYCNKDFNNLCTIMYGSKSSCALIIERAYIEAPSRKKEYSGSVYINCNDTNKCKNLANFIENRVSEDYKELFMIVGKVGKDIDEFEKVKDSLNKITLSKRIFCILDEFNSYKEKFLKNKDQNGFENIIASLKSNISKQIGISQERIIVTDQFKDIDKNTLNIINSNNELLKLVKLIKIESENLGKIIKIKPLDKEKIISISLNQERMSVQALMSMFYERYNGYLVDLWNKIIESEKQHEYYYSTIRTIIRNRKDDYREYRDESHKPIIDFSLRSGENNDSKKILKMMVNYGYNTVGFDSNENKILVSVNGEISKEDRESLINSIKGRLEESAINYFENAFLMNVSKKKFNANNLNNALESEKSITIDDFYSAFKELFKKMSENILRYEVSLQ